MPNETEMRPNTGHDFDATQIPALDVPPAGIHITDSRSLEVIIAPRFRMDILTPVEGPSMASSRPIVAPTFVGQMPNARRFQMSTMSPVDDSNIPAGADTVGDGTISPRRARLTVAAHTSTALLSPALPVSTSVEGSGSDNTPHRLTFTGGEQVVTDVPMTELTTVSLPPDPVTARSELPPRLHFSGRYAVANVSDSSSGSNSPAEDDEGGVTSMPSPQITGGRLAFSTLAVPSPGITGARLAFTNLSLELDGADGGEESEESSDDDGSDDDDDDYVADEAMLNTRPRGPFTAESFAHALLE